MNPITIARTCNNLQVSVREKSTLRRHRSEQHLQSFCSYFGLKLQHCGKILDCAYKYLFNVYRRKITYLETIIVYSHSKFAFPLDIGLAWDRISVYWVIYFGRECPNPPSKKTDGACARLPLFVSSTQI